MKNIINTKAILVFKLTQFYMIMDTRDWILRIKNNFFDFVVTPILKTGNHYVNGYSKSVSE